MKQHVYIYIYNSIDVLGNAIKYMHNNMKAIYFYGETKRASKSS